MNTAPFSPMLDRSVSMDVATVNACQEDDYMIVSNAGLFKARRAEGCLLVPEKGDKVLVAFCPQQVYILSILIRDVSREQASCVRLPSDTTLEASGTLTMQSDDLILHGKRHIGLFGRSLMACAGVLRLQGSLVELCGGVLSQTASTLVSSAQQIKITAQRCMSRLGKRTVHVEDADVLEAGRIRMSSRKSLHVRAEHAAIRTEKHLDLDGERINLG